MQNDLLPSYFAARVLDYPTLVGWLRNGIYGIYALNSTARNIGNS